MPGKTRLAPPLGIPAPEAQPPAGGLISLARRPQVDAEGRWVLGYTYAPEIPAGSVRKRSTLDNTYGANLGPGGRPETVEVVPVYLTVTDESSTFGFRADDPADRAKRLLEANTSRLLAHELWTGEIANLDGSPNPRLASADTTVVSGGPLDPQKAVAALVDEFGKRGMGDVMLHCSKRIGIQLPDGWRNEETLEDQGLCVVSDVGYPGTGPTGQAGQWMYATEIVNVRLDEIEVVPGDFADAVHPASNSIVYRAQRIGAADFAGPVLAIQVTA